MVFIHGGSFTSGSNAKTIYGPDYLIREDVIIVSINYRLGFLGMYQICQHHFNIFSFQMKFQGSSISKTKNQVYPAMQVSKTWYQLCDGLRKISKVSMEIRKISLYSERVLEQHQSIFQFCPLWLKVKNCIAKLLFSLFSYFNRPFQ